MNNDFWNRRWNKGEESKEKLDIDKKRCRNRNMNIVRESSKVFYYKFWSFREDRKRKRVIKDFDDRKDNGKMSIIGYRI